MAPLTVEDVMTRRLYAVGLDTSIETASRVLVRVAISGAPVVSDEGKALGVVSLFDLVDPDRDRGPELGCSRYYLVKGGVLAEHHDEAPVVKPGRVEEVMTNNVISVPASTRLDEAADKMLRVGIHRLLVMDAGELLGLVTSHDLLRGTCQSDSRRG